MKFSVIDGCTYNVYGVKADAIASELLKGSIPRDFKFYYKGDVAMGYKGSIKDYKKEYLKQYLLQRVDGWKC